MSNLNEDLNHTDKAVLKHPNLKKMYSQTQPPATFFSVLYTVFNAQYWILMQMYFLLSADKENAAEAGIISLFFSQSSPTNGWLGRVCAHAKYALTRQKFVTA